MPQFDGWLDATAPHEQPDKHDLVERGVEVLSRLSRMKASLADVHFIAGWVGEARVSIRDASSQLATVTQKLEIVRELAAEDALEFTTSFKEMEARATTAEAKLKAARDLLEMVKSEFQRNLTSEQMAMIDAALIQA